MWTAGGVVEGDDGDLVAVVELVAQVDEGSRSVRRRRDAAPDGGLGQPRPDRLGGVERGRAVGEFERGAVGQGDVERACAHRSFFASRPRTLRGLLTGEV